MAAAVADPDKSRMLADELDEIVTVLEAETATTMPAAILRPLLN